MEQQNIFQNIKTRGEIIIVETQFNDTPIELMFRERTSNYIFESNANVVCVYLNNTVNPHCCFDFDIKGLAIDLTNVELNQLIINAFQDSWIKDKRIGNGIFKITLLNKWLGGLNVEHFQ